MPTHPLPASPVTAATGARLAVARSITAGYAEDPGVVAVLCGGSTGRGHADAWSDLELGVFWTAPPSAHQRERAIAGARGHDPRQFGYDPAERGWFDEWWHAGPAGSGLLVEVVHVTVDGAHALLDDLLDGPDPQPHLLAFAAALAYGRVLHGSVAPWAGRVAAYPRPLAAAAIRRHGQIDHFWRWRMYADRRDPHGLRTHFARVNAALTHVACALNGRWWPGPKWPDRTLDGLALAPPRLRERLAAADALPPPAAAGALAELVEEAYDLVAEHLPETGADRLRAVFRFARAPWPPP